MKKPSRQSSLERIFENVLFQSRLVVVLAVVGSLVASILMFIKGALDIGRAAVSFVQHLFGHEEPGAHHEELSIALIGSIDSFLFATVLLIFAMGIYELFISEIDPASRTSESRPNWLEINSLDDLKGAVGKVILMILIVRLFESAVKMTYAAPLDLLYLGVAVALVSLALWLVHAGHAKAHAAKEHEPRPAARASEASHGPGEDAGG